MAWSLSCAVRGQPVQGQELASVERVLADVLTVPSGCVQPLMLMVLSEPAQALVRMQTQRYSSVQTLMLVLWDGSA